MIPLTPNKNWTQWFCIYTLSYILVHTLPLHDIQSSYPSPLTASKTHLTQRLPYHLNQIWSFSKTDHQKWPHRNHFYLPYTYPGYILQCCLIVALASTVPSTHKSPVIHRVHLNPTPFYKVLSFTHPTPLPLILFTLTFIHTTKRYLLSSIYLPNILGLPTCA